MKPFAQIAIVFLSFLALSVVHTYLARNYFSLADIWALYVPMGIVAMMFYLIIWRMKNFETSIILKIGITLFVASVLTACFAWLAFILNWAIYQGV